MTDELLRGLGRHQREALESEGEIDDDELLRPFDDAEREAMLDAVFQERVEPPAAEVVSLSSRRAAVIGVVLACAAALALLIWWGGDRSPTGREGAVAMLPEYTTTQLRGGQASQRGEPDEPLTLAPTDEIDWVVTPAEPVAERPAAVLIAERGSERALFVAEPDVEVAESGVIRMRGRLEQWFRGQAEQLEPGEWTLTLVITAASEQPGDLAEARASEGQRVVVKVFMVASRRAPAAEAGARPRP
jgi:hypothetical protein